MARQARQSRPQLVVILADYSGSIAGALVHLFSDGEHNVGSGPEKVAANVKGLNRDGEPVVIAVAGVSAGAKQPDERTFGQIGSAKCYVHGINAQSLAAFIASVGSSGALSAVDAAKVVKRIESGP